MRLLLSTLGLVSMLAFLGCDPDGCEGPCGPGGCVTGPETTSGLDTSTDTPTPDVSPDTPPRPDYVPVIFGVISDIHLEGGMEHGISKKVAALIEEVAGQDPAPEFISLTGDLVDHLIDPVDTGPGSKIDALRQIFAGAPVPVEISLGNHDYYTSGDAIFDITADPAARTQLFEDELGIQPWYYTEHGGMRFIYLNSMYDIERSGTSMGLNGSMGEAQLQWLDGVLAEGVKSILFMHHPPTIVLEAGDFDLGDVVRDNGDTVLGIFVGHIHVWGRDDFEGAPVYLTNAGYDGDGFHHVRVDPEAGTVEILNASEIDYGETTMTPCDPQRDPVLTDPAALEGAHLTLQVPDAHFQPMGLGTYLRELVGEIPIVVQLGGTAEGATEIAALITVGTRDGDGEGGAPGYVKSLAGGPCTATFLSLDGPCFSTAPVTLEIDIGKLLGFPLPPGWRLRAALDDFVLSGVLTDQGQVELGILAATLDFGPGREDVEAIITQEYCAGKLEGCVPGEGDMPPCAEPPTPGFFAEIPVECDVGILGIGMRVVFDIFESVPELRVPFDANFSVWPAEVLDEPAPGAVAPDLFAPLPEGNCPAL